MSVLGTLRLLFHGSDAKRAIADEDNIYNKEASRAQALAGKFRAAYGAKGEGGCLLGKAIPGGWNVSVLAKQLAAHALVIGPSGCGKSYFTTLLAAGFLKQGVERLFLADPKEETVTLFKAAICEVARSLPRAARERLLERVVEISLFSKESLPPLNVLAPIDGLDPELQAAEVTNLLTAELDQSCGVRQESLLYIVVQCLIRTGFPITVLPFALESPLLLERLAETHGPAELFRAAAERVRRESKERVLGIQSRIERILRLRSARLALGGSPRCIDFGALLDQVTLVNLAPPQGASDIARVMAGILWMNLSHAIRRRPNGAPRSHLIIDEFPVFLKAGGASMADAVEDLLRLARSKGVYLTALSQDLISIHKVSPSLPEVLRGNAHLFAVFRAVAESGWDFVLPVTGRRKRESAPWEDAKGGCLDRSAEMALLRQELSRLPDRELFFVDRRTGLPGVRMRTADLVLGASDAEVAALEARARRHPILESVANLERGVAEVDARVRALLDGAPRRSSSDASEEPLARRGARRQLDIG